MGLLRDYMMGQAQDYMLQRQADDYEKQRKRIDEMNQAMLPPGLNMSATMNPAQQELLQSLSQGQQTQQPQTGLTQFEQPQQSGGLIGSMLKMAMFGR